MEKRSLYDVNKQLVKKGLEVGKSVPDNMYVLITMIFIINDKNEVLVERCSRSRGGRYRFITSDVRVGEDSQESIIRKVYDDFGLKIENPTLINTFKGTNAFYDYYIYKDNVDIKSLVLQEDIDEVKWVSIDRIIDMIQKDTFYQKHIDVVHIINNYMNN